MALSAPAVVSAAKFRSSSQTHPLSFSSATSSGWIKGKDDVLVESVSSPGLSPVVSMAREYSVSSETATLSRRQVALRAIVAGVLLADGGIGVRGAAAVTSSRRALRSEQIPESEYKVLPSGLKIYDIKVGGGAEAVKGSRVAIHYVAKWKGITFMTSRQGMGVTGGTPYGFDVGGSERNMVLKGLDLGVEGMRVGGQRMLIVPPELAYGNRGLQEIPPGATLEFNVELLSIKQPIFGSN